MGHNTGVNVSSPHKVNTRTDTSGTFTRLYYLPLDNMKEHNTRIPYLPCHLFHLLIWTLDPFFDFTLDCTIIYSFLTLLRPLFIFFPLKVSLIEPILETQTFLIPCKFFVTWFDTNLKIRVVNVFPLTLLHPDLSIES